MSLFYASEIVSRLPIHTCYCSFCDTIIKKSILFDQISESLWDDIFLCDEIILRSNCDWIFWGFSGIGDLDEDTIFYALNTSLHPLLCPKIFLLSL